MLFNKNKYPDPDFYKNIPKQHQDQHPGYEEEMKPLPIYQHPEYQKQKKLDGKVAIITGGDSGIGRAVALAYAKEGAKVTIVYVKEDQDALKTAEAIEAINGQCLLLKGDLTNHHFIKEIVNRTLQEYGKVNILVNNAAVQYEQQSITDISNEQVHLTFNTNFFAPFHLIQEVLPHFQSGDSIINTTSITAYHGHDTLIDYSCTKGALVTLTRSLTKPLAKKGIRINAVAPGPIWTPLIPSSFDEEHVSNFGSNTAFSRPGQPVELSGAYVFLASTDASFVTGHTIHVNGGEVVNS